MALVVSLFLLLGSFLQSTYDAERTLQVANTEFQDYLVAVARGDPKESEAKRQVLVGLKVWDAMVTLKFLSSDQLDAWISTGTGSAEIQARLNDFLARQRLVYSVLQQLLFMSIGGIVLIAGAIALLSTKRRETEDLLRQLHQQHLAASEEERKALSRDLHDTVIQDLAAAKILLSQADQDVYLRTVASLNSAIDHVRQVAWGLRPPSLDTLGLFRSLDELCHSVSYRAKLPVRLVGTPFGGPLDEEIAVNLYRIVQEAMTNALRHGQPKSIGVEVITGNGVLCVMVHDDGVGFVVNETSAPSQGGRPGLGMVGIKERARMIGASLHIESSPGHGTRVKVEVPV